MARLSVTERREAQLQRIRASLRRHGIGDTHAIATTILNDETAWREEHEPEVAHAIRFGLRALPVHRDGCNGWRSFDSCNCLGIENATFFIDYRADHE